MAHHMTNNMTSVVTWQNKVGVCPQFLYVATYHPWNKSFEGNTFFSFLQKIKDRILILGVASLVAIDLVILVTYTLVEGIRGNLVAIQVAHGERETSVEGVSNGYYSSFM